MADFEINNHTEPARKRIFHDFTTPPEKTAKSTVIATVLFFLSYLPILVLFWIGLSPEGFDLAALQGYDHEFGIKAMELVLVRSFLSILFLPFSLLLIFDQPTESLPTLLPICIIYQIWCFLKVFLRRKKLRTTALVLTMVLFLSLFAVDPLSRIIRTNRDIPPLITDYLEELYGSDAVSDMKIILEDKVDCRYTVQSTPEGTLTLYYYPGGSRRSSDGTIYEDPDGPVEDPTHGRVYYGPGHDKNYEYGE